MHDTVDSWPQVEMTASMSASTVMAAYRLRPEARVGTLVTQCLQLWELHYHHAGFLMMCTCIVDVCSYTSFGDAWQ